MQLILHLLQNSSNILISFIRVSKIYLYFNLLHQVLKIQDLHMNRDLLNILVPFYGSKHPL